MFLGKIIGKVTTKRFNFVAESEPRNFEYVQVFHKSYGFVLCQIVELERDVDKLLAKCIILGYIDASSKVASMYEPFQVGTEVLYAEDDLVKQIVMLKDTKGAYIGKLRGRDIPVSLDLQKLLTKHLAVLAKSGSGKSYFVGCLLEEIIDHNVPLLLIDTHGEYGHLRHANDVTDDIEKMLLFDITAKGYGQSIVEYGDPEFNPESRQLFLSDELTPEEIMQLLPSKLSAGQENLLYAVMKDIQKTTLTDLMYLLDQEESPVKNQVINLILSLQKLGIFSNHAVDFNELIQTGRCSILNLRGIQPTTQEILVYKLLKDLFEARKRGVVPPFFCVVEEAHNFCPERSFGQTKSSDILRTIASEGRKFGMGLGIISQRPARVDKSVLSQITTQVILKVTNPNDLKAIMNSVEGISAESESEIRDLPIGSAMVTGIVDLPLFVSIRPRRSKHGGVSVDMLGLYAQDAETEIGSSSDATADTFLDSLERFTQQEKKANIVTALMPKISLKDVALMQERAFERIDIELIPAVYCICKEKETSYAIVIERLEGKVIRDFDFFETGSLPNLSELSKQALAVLGQIFKLKKCTFEELLQKINAGFMLKEYVSELVQKKYILVSNGVYTLNNEFILSNLSTCACYSKPDFVSVAYSVKREPVLSIDVIRQMVSRFVDVVEVRDCFVGKYVVIETTL